MASILFVEDDDIITRVFQAYLSDSGWNTTWASTGQQALDHLAQHTPDVLLVDINLPDMSGLDILRHVHNQNLPVAATVITSHASMDVTIDAMRLGARDFLVKPVSRERLLLTIENMIERQELSRLVDSYRADAQRDGFCGLIGSSPAMQAVYTSIENAATSRATVFIMGESGTGKELCAQAIHQKSPRAGGPFIAINCGAIPKDLMESELFGHRKGAFTGATANRLGAVGAAAGGTLFLDEIGELDISLQPKLLRFLQTSTYQPIGSDRTDSANVRIICASNRDPLRAIREGRLREDLYYRLHVLPITLPPLRERGEDVLHIARHFLALYSREEGKNFRTISEEAQAALLTYPWPGNVREVENVIRKIVVMERGETVTLAMLPDAIAGHADNMAAAATEPATPLDLMSLQQRIRPIEEVEWQAIEEAIELCQGDIALAAHFLKISPATIYRRRARRNKP